jgi:hypothetical protein
MQLTLRYFFLRIFIILTNLSCKWSTYMYKILSNVFIKYFFGAVTHFVLFKM